MLPGAVMALCVLSAPYGDNTLVPNTLVPGTNVVTGLFYSMLVPTEDAIVGQQNVSYGDHKATWKRDHFNGTVQDGHLFAFQPSRSDNKIFSYGVFKPTVRIFHKATKTLLVSDDEYLFMELTDVNYHLVKVDLSERLSQEKQNNFIEHCRESEFTLEEYRNGYFELSDIRGNQFTVYRTGTGTYWPYYFPEEASDSTLLIQLIPQNFKLRTLLTDFRYDDMDSATLESMAIDDITAHTWVYTNENYNQSNTYKLVFTKTTGNTVEWTFEDAKQFQHAVNVGASIQIGVEIPFTSSVMTEFSFGYNHEWMSRRQDGQRNATTDETTFSVDSEIIVGPRTKATFLFVWKRSELDLRYKAAMKMSAVADRLNADGTVSKMAPVDGEGVLALLKHKGFQEKYRNVGDEIVVHVNGSAHVSRAIRGEVIRRDTPLM